MFTSRDSPEHIIFSGVGKTKEELLYALHHHVRQCHIESISEIDMLGSLSQSLGVVMPVMVRLNPILLCKRMIKYLQVKKEISLGLL